MEVVVECYFFMFVGLVCKVDWEGCFCLLYCDYIGGVVGGIVIDDELFKILILLGD